MSILNVLSVGNGDCMIISPSNVTNTRCENEITKILIDLGPLNEGVRALSENIDITDNVHIFLTHSHKDHIGGIEFFTDKLTQIRELTVPFYQNEIVLIAEAILSLKGIPNFRENPTKDENFISLLREIVRQQSQLKRMVSMPNSTVLSFAYEDRTFDNGNLKCFNPPKIIKTYDWLRNLSSNLMNDIVNELFEDDFATNILNYLQNDDIQAFNDILLEGNTDLDGDELGAINRNKRLYIIDFIIRNLRLFSEFNSNPNRVLLLRIYDKFVKEVHDACIVLHANYMNKTFLFTGDATTKLLNRLIE